MAISAGHIIAIVAGIVAGTAAVRPALATTYAETTSISGSTLSGAQTFAATSGSAGITGNATLSGNVTFNLGFYVNSLAVGGGGAGGGDEGGGGGGGGEVKQAGFFISGGRVTAVIGKGGLGTSFGNGGGGETSYVRTGGAGEDTIAMATGGQGGNARPGGGGDSGNGNLGGIDNGGGGGAGGIGQDGPTSLINGLGNGGAGLVVTTFQTASLGTVFGGGGGGSSNGVPPPPYQFYGGSGGSGGGGAGYTGAVVSPGSGGNGTDGLGGGGGGGNTIGGDGGKGLVAISYLGAQIGTATAGTQAAGINDAAGSTVVTFGVAETGDFLLSQSELDSRLSATVTGDLSGSGGLTSAGPGTLVLAGNNSYAGPTVASSGRLVVNGTVGSGVTVNSGAVLGGTGRISGPVTVQAGGTFAPGQSPGVITVGSLSFSGAGTVAMEITGTSKSSPVQYDQIVGTSLGVTGTSTIDYTGGVLNLQMSGTYDVGTVFDLFTFPITTGTLSGVSMAGSSADWNGLTWSGPGAGQFDYGPGVWQSSWTTVGGQSRKLLFDQSTGDLVVVPEPSTLVMAGAGVAGLACMRWRRRGRRSATPAEKAAQTT